MAKMIGKNFDCQIHHLMYVISGRMGVRMDDGATAEFGPGDVGVVPPGHDAWVIGNEPVVAIDSEGPPCMQSRRAERSPKGSRVVITVLIASLCVILVRQASAFVTSPVREDMTAVGNAVGARFEQTALRPSKPAVDPDHVAYLEAAGWRAYYDRNWPRVFGLMVQMNRGQFGMPLPMAVAAAVDIVRAGIAFAPLDNDVPAATAHLQHFYEKARRSRAIEADARTLAEQEMDYWVVHRRLAMERKQAPNHEGDIEPMVASLARLHVSLFDAPPEAIRRSAELRAEAAKTVDRITGGYSADVEGDWRQVEEFLREAYRTLL